MSETINWKKFDEPRPYTSVIGMIFGPDGKFIAMHRSPEVRSAKNAWSLISGLHEVGLQREEQLAAECLEELHVPVVKESLQFIDVYEAILKEDQWHWVLHLYVGFSPTNDFVNKEPDKHDKIVRMTLDEIEKMEPWTANLKETLVKNMTKIKAARKVLSWKYKFPVV